MFRSKKQTLMVGADSPLSVTIPIKFGYTQEGDRTIFIIPVQDGINCPVNLRISYSQDVSEVVHSEVDLVTVMLKLYDKNNQGEPDMMKFGSNYMIPSMTEATEDGIDWLYLHHLLGIEKHICTATISIINDRSHERPVAKIRDSIPTILESLTITTA